MKLFGKKDDAPTDAPELDTPGETSEDGDPAFGDSGVEEGPATDTGETSSEDGELSAPARPLPGGGGGKKKALLLLGVLVALVAAGGGGYFYLQSQSDTAPLQPIPPRTAAVPPAEPAVPAATAPLTATATTPGAAAVLPAGTPPQPAPVGTPTNPATAVLGPTPSDEANAIPLTPGASAPQAAASATAAIPGAPAVVAASSPVALASPATAGMAAPPASATAAAVPAAVPVPPAKSPALAAAAPPGIEAPAEETPQDLPMPVSQAPAPASATPGMPVAAAPGSPIAPVSGAVVPVPASKPTADKTKAAQAPKGRPAEPSDAEKAIVQNAAVLDQLSTTSTPGQQRPFDPTQAPPDQSGAMKTVDQLLEQPATVRPLPPSWLTVKKEHDSDDVDTRLTLAREALAQNNNTAALQLFTELRGKYPKDKRVLMGRAVALQKLGQDDAALSAYEEVLNSDPKNLEALTNMLGLLKRKDPSLAVDKLEQLHAAYPYNADIAAQLGMACGAAGRYEDSMKYLDMAEALAPGNVNVIYNKAVLYDRMGKSQQAGDLYREVIRMGADGGGQELPMEAIRKRLAVLR